MRYLRVGAALLLLTGCTSTYVPEGPAPGVRVRDPRAPQAGIQLDRVVVLDRALQDWDAPRYEPVFLEQLWPPQHAQQHARLAVEQTNARRTATGTLEVWAVLRNRTDQPIQLEGRTTFFDAQQVPCEDPSAWQRVFLPPQGVATYRERSTQIEGVHHYYIELREGR